MRLQLTILILLLLTEQAFCQQKTDDNLPPAEIDILFSYYQQDGDSSAVTGGAGTEKLNDYASIINVYVPRKKNKALNVEAGLSHYTSASSDRIDPNTISSASSYNWIGKIEVTASKLDTSRNLSGALSFRGTLQNNLYSFGTGASISKSMPDKGRSYTLAAQFNYDKWAIIYRLSKLYPIEIRYSTEPLPTDSRFSTDGSITINQVINQKMQGMISLGVIYQWGLLSTPFHRVYFQEQENPDLERLPGTRIRIPFALRLNYYMNDWLILRTFYRYYIDGFGIQANTLLLETPLKITNFFSVYPYYRYYTQTASRYFAGYKKHHVTEQYHTSDYDLSRFNAHMLGAGLRYSPPLGINAKRIASQKTKTIFKTIEFRYGQYWRSNGLRSHIFSLNFSYLR